MSFLFFKPLIMFVKLVGIGLVIFGSLGVAVLWASTKMRQVFSIGF